MQTIKNQGQLPKESLDSRVYSPQYRCKLCGKYYTEEDAAGEYPPTAVIASESIKSHLAEEHGISISIQEPLGEFIE